MRSTQEFGHLRGRQFVVACCAILLLLCLLILASCAPAEPGGPNTSISTPIPLPTAAPDRPVTLQDLHMVDTMKGWAVSRDKEHLLYTVTGPAHWQDVTPNTGQAHSTIQAVDFLDQQNAWVVVKSKNNFSVFHSYNGGESWVEAPVPASSGNPVLLTFVDALNGWLILDKGTAAGSEGIVVFQTLDSGQTWLQVSSTDKGGQIPLSGNKSGLAFLNSSTGWLTGTTSVNNRVWLYRTHDSGATWQAQTLPLPGGKIQVTTMAPIFFGVSNGILPVSFFSGTDLQLDLYVTHDGGNTWQGTTTTSGLTTYLSFLDLDHAWAIGRNNNSKSSVYATSDGGKSWTQLTAMLAPNITGISELNFVSRTDGWALVSTAAESTALYQTIDGGKTWTQVNPVASS